MTVAVLFARADSIYKTLPACDVYDIARDARWWPGGGPVVARWWPILHAGLGGVFAHLLTHGLTRKTWRVGLCRWFSGGVVCLSTLPEVPYGQTKAFQFQVNATNGADGRSLRRKSGGGTKPRRLVGSTSSDVSRPRFHRSPWYWAKPPMLSRPESVTTIGHTSARQSGSERRPNWLAGWSRQHGGAE